MPPAGGGPLAGIRVLDFTRFQNGPSATLLLSDYGERGGEPARGRTVLALPPRGVPADPLTVPPAAPTMRPARYHSIAAGGQGTSA
eukprot:gene8000-7616_t